MDVLYRRRTAEGSIIMSGQTIVLQAPFNTGARMLRAGQRVLLSGRIYTARDAAHARMALALEKGEALPVDLKNEIIYYTGPCPPQPGKVIGSCGPTTSSRMDAYTPLLLENGLIGMIGKGDRGDAVIEAMRRCGAVYFAATGGAGALLSRCVTQCTCVAYEDLGTEAVYRLHIKDFPLIVAIDAAGNNLYRK